jgi:two-component system nitrate/nitrite response regulator NarL
MVAKSTIACIREIINMRALWIEDHVLIGESLELLLKVVRPDIALDKARSVEEALEFAREHDYAVVIVDWWIGNATGEHAMRTLRAIGCQAPFLVVSGDDRALIKEHALHCGASSFLSKNSNPEVLVSAIDSVLLAPGSPCAVSNHNKKIHPPSVSVEQLFPELTARQREVLLLLTKGMTDKQIARELNVGSATVRTHVRGVIETLGVHSRGEAAYKASSRGLIGK